MLLNESYLNNYQIKKGGDIGYLVIEPSEIKIHYEVKQKIDQKKKCQVIIYPKTGQKNGKTTSRKKKISSDERVFK